MTGQPVGIYSCQQHGAQPGASAATLIRSDATSIAALIHAASSPLASVATPSCIQPTIRLLRVVAAEIAH